MVQTEDAKEDFESRTSHGPVVFGTWHVQPGLSLTGSYRYADIEYDAVQGIFPHAREDGHHVADFGVLWDVSKYVYPGTAVRAQYTYIRADSNLALYDNRRHIVAVGMQIVF